MPDRLDKLVASATQYSRKQASSLIRQGKVLVDGAVVIVPSHLCPPGARLTLNGIPLVTGPRYYMLNKPIGVVCATRDNRDSTVLELLPLNDRKNLFPAGRLDKDSEGFVLLTDDGPFAHRLLAPKSAIPKTYRVTLTKAPEIALLRERFSRPMDLGGGDVTTPAVLGPVAGPEVELTIYEGMYHQVKRMFLQCGYPVVRLVRFRIGGLSLDPALLPGSFRPLTLPERDLLLQQTPD